MKKKIAIIIVLVVLCLCLFELLYKNILKKLYPDTYSEYVNKYSEKYDIEKEWIFALIKTESNFKKDSISQSGAIGLTQLMESTAKEVSNEIRNKRNRFKRRRN